MSFCEAPVHQLPLLERLSESASLFGGNPDSHVQAELGPLQGYEPSHYLLPTQGRWGG